MLLRTGQAVGSMTYVYILQSQKNGRYYIGSTNNPQIRLQQHNDGQVTATKYTRPFVLVFKQMFETQKEARVIEAKLKKFKSRRIIEQIIADGIIKTVGA